MRGYQEDDWLNLHWHADVKKLTVVALICIVPEITCIVHEITSKYLKLSENTSWYQMIPHSTNSMRKPNNTWSYLYDDVFLQLTWDDQRWKMTPKNMAMIWSLPILSSFAAECINLIIKCSVITAYWGFPKTHNVCSWETDPQGLTEVWPTHHWGEECELNICRQLQLSEAAGQEERNYKKLIPHPHLKWVINNPFRKGIW